MKDQTNLKKSFLTLIEFLLLSKRNLVIAAEKLKLTPIQALTLFLLDETRPMNSFTKIFHCDASNTTGIIDGLEKKKLVSRYESKSDRRVKMIKITPKGTVARDQIIADQFADENFIFNKLNESETTTFVNLIEKIKS